MIDYRRKKNRGTWHWCRNCPRWPHTFYETVHASDDQAPGSGNLCKKCFSRERKHNCR